MSEFSYGIEAVSVCKNGWTPEGDKITDKGIICDAIAGNELHPSGGPLPSPAKMRKIKVGDLVHVGVYGEHPKVGATIERFWVKVTAIKDRNSGDPKYTGYIVDPIAWGEAHGLFVGNEITVNRKHIIDVAKG